MSQKSNCRRYEDAKLKILLVFFYLLKSSWHFECSGCSTMYKTLFSMCTYLCTYLFIFKFLTFFQLRPLRIATAETFLKTIFISFINLASGHNWGKCLCMICKSYLSPPHWEVVNACKCKRFCARQRSGKKSIVKPRRQWLFIARLFPFNLERKKSDTVIEIICTVCVVLGLNGIA